jgi:diguanylate cyclase (GGDEF)-like protein
VTEVRRRIGSAVRARPSAPILRDPAIVARTYAYLFGIGTALLLVTLALPADPDRDRSAILIVAGTGGLASAAYLRVGGRAPRWSLDAAPAIGSLMVTVIVYFAGPGAMAAYAMYYPWIILAAANFCGLRLVSVHVAIALGGYAIVLLVRDEVATGLLSWAMVAGTLAIAAGLALMLRTPVDALIDRLDLAARTDPLTGLANRREFNRRFQGELDRSARTGRPFAVVAMDLDGFKRVNDSFGHATGDQVLRRFAALMREGTREIDTVARTGGEEFAVLVPETGVEPAREAADRLRRSAEGTFTLPDGPLTASFGIAGYPASATDGAELLRAADRALYAAKRGGRNRTIAYDPEHHGEERMSEPPMGWTAGLAADLPPEAPGSSEATTSPEGPASASDEERGKRA